MNPTGKKRPVLKGPDGRMTPVPWVAGDGPEGGEWAFINKQRAEMSELNKLCIVCGEFRGVDWVYALLHGSPRDIAWPCPTYGHPECILKAVLYCPHLKNQEYPAMLQDRYTAITADQLKEIVKQKKILKRNSESFASGSADIFHEEAHVAQNGQRYFLVK